MLQRSRARQSSLARFGDIDALTPSQKGAVAEAAISAAALELGLTVLRPLCEGRRYDIVFDLEPRLLRVQCKLARRHAGALSVAVKTNRCTPAGYVSTSYTEAEIDAIGAYSPELRRCFLIPVAEVVGRRSLHLRLTATNNNQLARIRWARDYEMDTVIARMQAGAKRAVEAAGSYTFPD